MDMKFDKTALGKLIKNSRDKAKSGKSRFDPALANLLFKSQAEVDADIAIALEEFINKKGRQPTEEELADAYVILEEKRKELTDKEVTPYVEANAEEVKVANEMQQQVETQNQSLNAQVQKNAVEEVREEEQELFILTIKGNGDRLFDREEEQKTLEDRQRAIAEKTLRVLEALEKARDAVKKGEKIPEMDLSYLKELTPKEFAKQMNVFKDFGLEPVLIGDDGKVRENPEREVTLETITLEDLELDGIAFAISFEKLKSKDFRNIAELAKESCKKQNIKSEYEPDPELEDDKKGEGTIEAKKPRVVDDDEFFK